MAFQSAGDGLDSHNQSDHEEKGVGFNICMNLKITLYAQTNPSHHLNTHMVPPRRKLLKLANQSRLLPLRPRPLLTFLQQFESLPFDTACSEDMYSIGHGV